MKSVGNVLLISRVLLGRENCRNTNLVPCVDYFFLLIFLFSVVPVTAVAAEVVRVDISDSEMTRELELDPGERAQVEVHLQSLGHMVENYEVGFYRVGQQAELATGRSDAFGVVRFANLRPGHYRITLRKNFEKNSDPENTVSVGDLKLQKWEPTTNSQNDEQERSN